MQNNIESIEGIGPVFKSKFLKAGIMTVEDLLTKTSSPSGLSEVARVGGFKEETVKKWAGMADLFRISGISTQWSELLSAGGVHSVRQLATRNPKKLHKKLVELNTRKKICRSVPHPQTIKNFVEQAKELPKTYFL